MKRVNSSIVGLSEQHSLEQGRARRQRNARPDQEVGRRPKEIGSARRLDADGVIEAEGDNYRCGYEFGRVTKASVEHRLDWLAPEIKRRKHAMALQGAHRRCLEHYPAFARELEGIADGAGVDYWRLLLLNFPELLEWRSGCTSIATRRGGDTFLLHNEDGKSQERLEDCVLVHYTIDSSSFYAFTYAGELPGGSYSWNRHHLYLSVNYLEPIDDNCHTGISRNFVARAMIEAKDAAQAISILEHSRDASGYHYYLGQGDVLYSIENLHDQVSATLVTGTDFHTNHYLHDAFAAKAPSDRHSRVRYERAGELLKENVDGLAVLADRAHAPLAICSEPLEGLRTISTIGFFPKRKRVVLYEPGTLREEGVFKL